MSLTHWFGGEVVSVEGGLGRRGADLFGLGDHHVAVHEYARDALGDGGQHGGACAAGSAGGRGGETCVRACAPMVMFGTKWLGGVHQLRRVRAAAKAEASALTRP